MIEYIVKYWVGWAFGLVAAAFAAGYARLSKRLKAEKEKSKAIENGVRDILRMQILDSYDKCMAAGGKISVSRKDALDSAYKSYSALGGNGTITQVHDEIMHMPIL